MSFRMLYSIQHASINVIDISIIVYVCMCLKEIQFISLNTYINYIYRYIQNRKNKQLSGCINTNIFALENHISTSKPDMCHIRQSRTFISSKTLSVSHWNTRLHYRPALIKAGNV